MKVHPTSIVEDGVHLGKNVEIGPFCYVGDNVTLGDEVKLISHVRIEGNTSIGAGTIIHAFASIGALPQSLKSGGATTRLEIGSNNVIREHVSMHRGTDEGGGVTSVGNNGMFMDGCHVAHDCKVGNNVIFVNNALIGGHVVIEDHATIGGGSAVKQFVRVGRCAFISGMSGITKDVIPYVSVQGYPANLRGINLVGMQRREIERKLIRGLRAAYDMLFLSDGTFPERLQRTQEQYGDNSCVREVIDFVNFDIARHYVSPRE